MNASPESCATELLEIVPLLMRVIRAEVRRHQGSEMSVPQFRTLAFIGRNENSTLSELSSHLGLTLSAASKLVEGLVSAGYARREMALRDRRQIALNLTKSGQKRYQEARASARRFLSDKIEALDGDAQTCIWNATLLLKNAFEIR